MKPLLAAVAAALIAAPAASAEPIGDLVIAYAATFGGSLCAALDTQPTHAMITNIGQAIVDDGLTWEQAGQVVYLATTEICPRHRSLVLDYAGTYLQGTPI